MPRYSLTHLSNEALRRALSTTAASERGATAELIAHIAEFDARKLFLRAAYPSMFAYCVGELHLSEDAAKKRLQEKSRRAWKRFRCRSRWRGMTGSLGAYQARKSLRIQ
jgi:hypothetical protein